jgi:aryl sulfotransferase
MTGGMVWLASYPKCGNTWLRSFLDAYFHADAQVDLNALETPTVALRVRLDAALAIDTADLYPQEVRDLLPIALRVWAELPGGPHFVKVHDAYGLTRQGLPVFPPEVTRGVVHLVRDPRDVVLSLRHHWGATVDDTVRRLNNPNEWVALGRNGPDAQVPQWLSSWSAHAQSWLDAPLPRLTLRYEDMLTAPHHCFRQILAFCQVTLDEAKLNKAVDATSFARLQAKEAEGGFRERPAKASAPLFRAGRAGGWRDVLTPQQVAAIVDAHGDMMRRLGYEVD